MGEREWGEREKGKALVMPELTCNQPSTQEKWLDHCQKGREKGREETSQGICYAGAASIYKMDLGMFAAF